MMQPLPSDDEFVYTEERINTFCICGRREALEVEVERLREIVARAREHAVDVGDEALWAKLFLPRADR